MQNFFQKNNKNLADLAATLSGVGEGLITSAKQTPRGIRFGFGAIRQGIFVVGIDKDGCLTGVTTKAVET